MTNTTEAFSALQEARRARLRQVHERHEQHSDFEPVVQDALAGNEGIPRWAPVVKDAAAGFYAIGLHETLNAALGFLALDVYEWEPHALYDLDTGKSLPLNVSTVVTVPDDDPAAATEEDLTDVPRATLSYRCPTDQRSGDDVTGCGHVFEATPDEEGMVDCPRCGMWFLAAVVEPDPTFTIVLQADPDDIHRALQEIGCDSAEIHPGRLVGE